jgi:hypothetical protein
MPFEEYTNTEREQRVEYVASTLMQNPKMGIELLYDLSDDEVAQVFAMTKLMGMGAVVKACDMDVIVLIDIGELHGRQ